MIVGETTDRAAGPTFVGRSSELAFARRSLDGLEAGPLHLVWIEGASGSGKTSLLREVLRSVPPEVLVLRAAGDEQERLVDGSYLGQLLSALDPELFDGRPGIFEVPAGRATAAAAGAAMLEVLGTIVGARPLLLVLDDLHWADRLSLDVLRFVLRRLRADPVGVLAALRSEDVPAVGEAWLRLRTSWATGQWWCSSSLASTWSMPGSSGAGAGAAHRARSALRSWSARRAGRRCTSPRSLRSWRPRRWSPGASR